MRQLDRDTLRAILESAILAPSADNHHRVRFRLDQNTLHVTYTEPALPHSGGYKRALVLMSLGALIENLSISASQLGFRAIPSRLPESDQSGWSIHIDFQPDQIEADPLWKMIPLRHTNRRVLFRGPEMTPAERTDMEQATRAFPGCQLIWLDEVGLRRRALRLMRRAETERFRTRLFHDELFSAIRFDAGWRATCPEGLPPGALGVERPLRQAFALLRHWPVMRVANLVGGHHMMGWRACDLPCRLAPHVGLLAVKNPDDQSMFDVGRAFQRVWLTATAQGRVLQPMPASAIFALEEACAEGVPVGTQRALAQGWKAELGGLIPLMLFRMGHASPLPVATARAALETYMEPEKGSGPVASP